jgi:hypothetical protein
MDTNPKFNKRIKNWLLVPAFILLVLSGLAVGYFGVLPFFLDPKIEVAKKVLELEEPLVIKFNKSVVRHKVESTFSLTPSMIGKISWEGNNLVFTPIQPWKPGGDYEIELTGLTDFANQFAFRDYFFTENLPQVQKFNPSGETLTGPLTPIEFHMDKGSDKYQLNFKVAPAFNYKLAIDPERKFFQVNPEEPLKPNTQYQIIAYESYQAKDNKNWYGREVANFQFKTVAPPEIQKILPASEEKDVTEFDPLKIYFSKPMKAEEWPNFVEISPKVEGKVEWQEDGKLFIFKPYRWSENTDYSVKVKGGFRAADETYLDKDFLTKFRSYDSSGQVKKQSASATNEARIKEGRYVDINLAKQILSIFDDGKNMGNYRISSGKRGMATPTGMFKVLRKNKRAWSKRYGLFMPYWMQFTNQGHGMHELPEWPGGYKEGANHLGIPVSHGCVRLGVGPAKTVFNFVDVGTPIYIHY